MFPLRKIKKARAALNELARNPKYAPILSDIGIAGSVLKRILDYAPDAKPADKAPVPTSALQETDAKNFRFHLNADGDAVIDSFCGFGNIAQVVVPRTLDGKAVVAIADGAFHGCSALKTVVLHDGIRSLGEETFKECTALSQILDMTGVTHIGRECFYRCVSLKTVDLPNTLVSLEHSAFVLSGITQITIPGSLKLLGGTVFFLCKDLKEVLIEEGVETIGHGCFEECKNLRSVNIPASVKMVIKNAFRGCPRLSEMHVYTQDALWDETSSPFCSNHALTVYCYPGATVQTHCRKHNIKCLPLEE